MKTLIVYHTDSYEKYQELYRLFTFEIDEIGILRIFKISKVTGKDFLVACYKDWTYFRVEGTVD